MYGIPPDIVDLIREIYRNNHSCVFQNGNVSDWFKVETGVRQGCVMSGFLFIVAIDWIMRSATDGQRSGIRWKFTSTLDDLDYADDIALLSSTHSQLQCKTARVHTLAKYVGLNINTRKTQVMKLNPKNSNPVLIGNEEIEEVENFTYLGSKVSKTGGAEKDIIHRLSLARNAFSMLNPVWKSSNYSVKTKLRILQSNVLSVLLYGAEMWRMTEGDANKINVFHRRCLRRIMRIHWPRVVSNDELYRMTHSQPVAELIKVRRWRWIGHILRRDNNNNSKIALTWTPEGKRKRGRPKTTWRRTVEAERKSLGWNSWAEVEEKACDRQGWQTFLRSLTVP